MKYLLPSLGLVMVLTITIVTGYKPMDGTDVLNVLLKAAAQYDTAEEMAKSVKCIVKSGWSTDLTLAKLNSLVGTVVGTSYGSVYIFAPECHSQDGRLFTSGSGAHAEDNLVQNCGTVSQFYLSSAPCPDCAMMLLNTYAHSHHKPTIYIARPYQGKGKSGVGNKAVNTMCLAMLVHAGFTVHPWNWSTFSNYLTDDECKNVINHNHSGLQERDHAMTQYLSDVATAVHAGGQDFGHLCQTALNG